jgi:hypothetical protein
MAVINVQQGLERVSAVWWGMWAALSAALLVGGVIDSVPAQAGMGFGGIVAAYVAHRITCWMLAGFFLPRS